MTDVDGDSIPIRELEDLVKQWEQYGSPADKACAKDLQDLIDHYEDRDG